MIGKNYFYVENQIFQYVEYGFLNFFIFFNRYFGYQILQIDNLILAPKIFSLINSWLDDLSNLTSLVYKEVQHNYSQKESINNLHKY